MAGRSISDRVEILEKKVEELSALPARMSALTENVASLRTELLRFRGKSEEAHSETRALISQMYDLATKQAYDIRGELVGRFDAVDQRFDGVGERFDSVDRRFDRLEDTLTEQFAQLAARLPPRPGAHDE
jgi:hypothetical protein